MIKKQLKTYILKINIVLLLIISFAAQASIEPLTNKDKETIADYIKKARDAIPPTTTTDFANQYMNPLLGGTKLKTPDGTTFNAQISCPSSKMFLEILIQPSSTGDLNFLQLARDKDFDGKLDSAYKFDKPVSGVCANGLLSCDVGTWENCKAYQWQAQSNNLTLEPSQIKNLGGCYCINSSCMSRTQRNKILSSASSDLGSGAASALSRNRPEYTISSVQTITPLMVRFFGQNTKSCNKVYSDISGETKLREVSKYVNLNKGALELGLQQLTENEKRKTENNLYDIIINSASAQNTIYSNKNCELRRETSYTNNCRCTDDSEPQSCGSSCPVVYKIEPGEWQANKIFDREWLPVTDTCDGKWRDPFDGPYTEECLDVDLIRHWKTGIFDWGTHRSEYRVREIIKYIDESMDKTAQKTAFDSCKFDQELIRNSCEVIEQDNNCRLKTEVVDNVETYKQYQPTLKSPIPSTKNVGSDLCKINLKRPWWLTKREYNCEIEAEFNFNEGLKRKESIEQSLTYTGSSLTYTDLGSSISTAIPKLNENFQKCTNACKTKRLKDKVLVSNKAPVNQNTGDHYEFIYRKCTGPNNNICPFAEDEELITNCSCLNEFGTASTLMQSLVQAGSDLLCTTGELYTYE